MAVKDELEDLGFPSGVSCYCGCGEKANPDRFFKIGHDRRFEAELLSELRGNCDLRLAIRRLIQRGSGGG